MASKSDSTSKLDAACYLAALKAILKERGITYSDLAHSLECSLPTVKRALNKSSLSLTRLLEIAGVARVSLAEICERAAEHQPKHFVFTPQQDQMFSEREELLAYFIELATTENTPGDIAQKHGLDRRSTVLYLTHLERLGLIKRTARNHAKLLVKPPFGFAAGGPYLRSQCRDFLKAVVSSVVDADPPDPNCTAILKPLMLTEKDYRQFIGEIMNLIDRFAAISERRIGKGKTSLWQIAIACGPGPEHRPGNLPRIQE